ncbi:MAG: hypothetical protein WD767_04040 [Alphaproteobacteria bacterium]
MTFVSIILVLLPEPLGPTQKADASKWEKIGSPLKTPQYGPQPFSSSCRISRRFLISPAVPFRPVGFRTRTQSRNLPRSRNPFDRRLADLCNAAKHRILHVRGSGAEAAAIGPVNYIIEDLRYAEDFIARLRKFSTVLNIRTQIEDDEIAYLDVRTETHKLTGPDGFRLFIDICNEAIRFWEDFLKPRDL